MKWTALEHSKNSVRQAAKKLVGNQMSNEERMKCLSVVANFRSAHGYPMQSMIVDVKRKALKVDKKAIVVRRLKRIPSIIHKLKRFPSMQVSTMGDIGGMRVIVTDIKKARELRTILRKSRTKNKLISEKDYLAEPKASGYRSIHLTYSYQGQKKDYQDFRVELQIRSQVQHSWATAVEVVGTFTKQNLKASMGDQDWLNFFQLTSRAFAYLEEGEAISEPLKKKIQEKVNSLNVEDTLLSYTVITKHSEKKEGFYLLRLDIEEQTIVPLYFNRSLLLEAYDHYRIMEQEVSEDETQDVVLVSARSLQELRKAFPNYFADTLIFLENLKKVL